MKKDHSKISFHPAVHGGSHFIFSPEAPRAENKTGWNPDQVKHSLKLMGETVEDTHGSYGGLERSFIVHDPKDINKLHQLAHNLGQESAIVSNNGSHEMHYYHGPHAGKIRSGTGSQIHDDKPEDMYTKVTTPDGSHRFFTHNFDWDDNNMKPKQNHIAKSIFKVINEGNDYNEKTSFQRYWGLILEDKIEKNLHIRTQDRVFVSMDGDNIGASVERAAMANDLDTIMRQSSTIAGGQKYIRQWALNNNADIYIDGGDDIAFTLPLDCVSELTSLKRGYYEQTSFTITIGVGDTISRAGHAMLYGKLKGKNQINVWSPEISEELERISVQLSPAQKMQGHGLIKDELPGGRADNAKVSEFDPDQLLIGIDHETEHTKDKSKAKEIAMDHLKEDPDYYKKLKTMEKAEAPPKKPGQMSEDGRYIAQHHKPARMLAWRYNDKESKRYDDDIDQNKDSFTAAHPEQHRDVINSFINNIRNQPFRHFVISRDTHSGGDQIRARHIRGLVSGDNNYKISVENPDTLHFTINERHGNTPNKSSHWTYDKKTNKVFTRNTDKTNGSNLNVAKSDTDNQYEQGSWHRPLVDDTRTVYGLSELVQYIRYNGESKGSGRSSKASQYLNKSDTTKLFHFSTKSGLTSIDPKRMGEGLGQKGAESRYGRPEVERSYFYKEGTEPESVITSIGKARYTAELGPEHKIYDLANDHEGIHDDLKHKASSRQTNPGMVTSDEYLQAIKDKGYHGFTNSASHLPNVIALFHPHPVKEDKEYKKSESLNKSNSDEDLMDRTDADSDAKKPIPTLDNYSEHHGKNVFVYFNLHKNLWSVKDRKSGKVLFHSHNVAVDSPNLTVGEKGRQRVLKEKSKNVHAGVSGSLVAPKDMHDSTPTQISYNPYKAGHFYHAGQDPETSPAHTADHVSLQLAQIDTPKGQMNVPNVRAINPKHNGFGITQAGEQIPIDHSNFGSKRGSEVKKHELYFLSLYEDLQKSKNIKEQKAKTWGTQSNPTNPDMKEKHLSHVKDKMSERYNVEARITPGKENKSGKHIMKPTWESGFLEYEDNPDAAIHEGAHLEIMPEGTAMPEHQRWMDKEFGRVNKPVKHGGYGWAAAKQTQGEIQPMSIENLLRRRLGLPANTMERTIKEPVLDEQGNKTRTAKGTLKTKSRRPTVDDPQLPARDTGTPSTVRVPYKKGTFKDLIRQSRLATDENRDRVDDVDQGILVHDKDKGWVEGTGINAKINRRAKEKAKTGVKEYFLERLAGARAKNGVTPLASSEKIEELKNRYGINQEKVPYNQYFKKRLQEKKDQYNQAEQAKQKDPFKENMRIKKGSDVITGTMRTETLKDEKRPQPMTQLSQQKGVARHKNFKDYMHRRMGIKPIVDPPTEAEINEKDNILANKD